MVRTAIIGIVVVAAVGCKSDTPSASDDKALRANFAKSTFDIKDVPADQKARVQGFIDRAKEMAAKGQSPGAGK